jgi:hypothetical protein
MSNKKKLPGTDEPSFGKCNALLRNWRERFGMKRFCSQTAGWKTEHPGEGRCKLHGGLSTGPKCSVEYLEKTIRKTQRRLIEQYLEMPEEDQLTLAELLAIGKIALAKVFSDLKKNFNEKWISLIPKLMESIRKTSESIHERKYGDKLVVNVTVLNLFVTTLMNELRVCNKIEDENERWAAFAEALERNYRKQLNAFIRDVDEIYDIPKAEQTEVKFKRNQRTWRLDPN